MDETPPSLRTAAYVMIASGLANLFVVSALNFLGLSVVCGALTFGLGSMCGFLGCMLVPLGIFEVVIGAITLVDPRQFGPLCRAVGFVETGAILFGAPVTSVAGFVVVSLTAREDVVAFLADPRRPAAERVR